MRRPRQGGAALAALVVMISTGTAQAELPTFEPFTGSPFAQPQAVHARFADLSGDGRADLVSLNYDSGSVTVRAGQADGTLGAPETTSLLADGGSYYGLAVGDVTGDSAPDVVISGDDTQVFAGSASGALSQGVQVHNTGFSYAVAVVQADGDSRLEIAVGDYNADLIVFLDDPGTGTFATAPAGLPLDAPGAIVTGQLDGDPGAELAAVAYDDLEVRIWDSPADADPQVVTSPIDLWALGAGDVDGDGDLDLVAPPIDAGDTVTTLRNDGSGQFAAAPAGPVVQAASDAPDAVVVEDLDGDGDDDAVVTAYGFDTVSFLESNGDGTWKAPVTITPDGPEGLDAGDVDGDGDPDLAISTYEPAQVLVLRNPATFPAPVADAVDAGAVEVGAAAERDVTVRNTTGAPLRLGQAVVDGAPGFTIMGDGCSGVVVAGRGACVVRVRFAPAAGGDSAGALRVPGPISSRGAVAALRGTGVVPPPAPPAPPLVTPPPVAPASAGIARLGRLGVIRFTRGRRATTIRPGLALSCPAGGAACVHRVTATAKRKRRSVTIAGRRMTVAPGTRAAITLTANRTGRGLLRRGREVAITILVRGATGNAVLARRTVSARVRRPR